MFLHQEVNCPRKTSICTDVVTGHEIAPNTVANATKIIVLATKIQKLVAKLATRNLWVLYIFTLMIFATKFSFEVDESARTMRSVKQNRNKCYETEHVNICNLGFSKC